MPPRPDHVVVIGAGPSGLTAALSLREAGVRVTIVEGRPTLGGLGGTTRFEGRHGVYRFDFGGHRFITHNADLLRLVEELVGPDLLVAVRRSVIRLGGRIYDYPLSLANLAANAPLRLLAGAARDLAHMTFRRRSSQPLDFATWTKSRFGDSLYRTFFEGYTRKLWGVEPDRLSADWAEQRISLIDLRDVARRLLPGAGRKPRTYASSYRYPRHGFGVIFERLAARLVRQGCELRLGTKITGLGFADDRVTAVETTQGPILCDAVVSTMPLPDMVRLTGGQCALRFRGVRFLNIPMAVADVSPWTWQYLSDPDMIATRLQEPKRRSAEMAPEGMSSLMLEIPCDPGDALWTMDDDALFERVRADLARLGVDPNAATGEAFSVRAAHAYPLMVCGYERERVAAMAHLARHDNLIQCGRQGAFRYVFADTAMEMGQMAAASLLSGVDMRAAIYDHRNQRTVIETESVA